MNMSLSAENFLKNFPGRHWLQTFPDDKVLKTKQTDLARSFQSLTNHSHAELTRLNSAGAGIYVTINELKQAAKERSNENIESVRAFFLDLDGAPLEPVFRCAMLPDLIVQTSQARFHAYWLLKEKNKADRNQFRDTQKAIAATFEGDRSINDLCRVMRLPGFYNMKAEPFLVRWAAVDGCRAMDEVLGRMQ